MASVIDKLLRAGEGRVLARLRNYTSAVNALEESFKALSDEELKTRLAQWKAPEPPLKSGYWKLYIDHVLQADEGADLDFLVGQRGAFVPKDNH